MKLPHEMNCLEAAQHACSLMEAGEYSKALPYIEHARATAQSELNLNPKGRTARTVRKMNRLLKEHVDSSK